MSDVAMSAILEGTKEILIKYNAKYDELRCWWKIRYLRREKKNQYSNSIRRQEGLALYE